jgi:hypothetical protein
MEGLLGHVQWIVTTFGLLATLYGTGTISTGATVGALEHLRDAATVHNQSAAPNGFMHAETEYPNERFKSNDP